MRIPYSAIRFPATECQKWGLQIYRNVRRTREVNQWALEEPSSSNNMIYWGTLNGLCDIKSPINLLLTPYLSTATSHFPSNLEGTSNYSRSFGGGMDLKYGINESFTLDMTLMPDFSQVPSDNEVKNLSAFETVHGEQRPFFKESMDLFNRGGLFHSRRIGQRPSAHRRAASNLKPGEYMLENPGQAKLVNAFKLSGRAQNGMAVGVFNAVTDHTYATYEDSLGQQHRILTEPLTNFNILVFDKALRSNSNVYLINTNVLRAGGNSHANVTGAGFSLVDHHNTYRIRASSAVSQLISQDEADPEATYAIDMGLKYELGLERIRGNFRFNLRRNALGPDFDDNDLGLTQRRDQIVDRLDLHYNIYQPFWKLRHWRSRLTLRNEALYHQYITTSRYVEAQINSSTLEYFSFSGGMNFHLQDRLDYYEPRVAGRVFVKPRGRRVWTGFSSDYRNPFALDFNMNIGAIPDFSGRDYAWTIAPRYRFSDQLSFVHSLKLNYNFNDVGFAQNTTSGIIFGNRDVTTVENVLSSDYILTNDIYFSFRMRQYWSKGEYDAFFKLLDDGRLEPGFPYAGNRDFNFNSFNIDFVFTWLFAPGSSLNLVWKNAVRHEQQGLVDNYFGNFGLLRDAPKYNSLSLKILYYLDYQQLRRG